METVYLRALELDDLERTHRWHNDPALYDTLIGSFRYVSREAEKDWLIQRLAYSQQEVNLAICLSPDGRHVGNAYLRPIDWTHRHAQVGMFIAGADQRGQGHGTAAFRLLIKHAFQDLGLRRLYAYFLEGNEPAQRMAQKCGFVQEGRLRQHLFKKGGFHDLILVGLLRE